MKKLFIVMMIMIGSIVCINASAATLLTGSDIITYPREREKKSEILFKKYSFSVAEHSNVTLHFISNVDKYINIKVIETSTENPINALCRRIAVDDSPFSETVDLQAGNYTLMVYKSRSSMSNHNTGAYRFEITGNSIPVIEAVETVVEPKTSDVSKEQQINGTENYKSNQQEDGIKDKNQSENKETDNSLTGMERLVAFMSNIINIFGGKSPIFGVIVSIVLWIVGSRS